MTSQKKHKLIDVAEPQAASAAVKVLAVTELREAIITHLLSRDVLVLQRVSKTWQATILGHSMLQRALGFEANSLPSVTCSQPWDDEDESNLLDFYGDLSAIHFLESSKAQIPASSNR